MKIFLTLLFAVLATTASGESLLQKPTLVSSDWLAEQIDHPEIRILDARSSLGPYMQGHIPGAIYLNTETLRISEGGVPASLLPPEALAEIFGKLGIGNQHTVVIYSSGEEAFAHAAYLAFVLEWLGHQSVGVLDGGFDKWNAEDRALTSDFPSLERAAFEPRADPALLKKAQDVKNVVSSQDAVLLDARPPQQFEAAHIPSARSFFLERTIEGDDVKTWKSPEDLRRLAAEVGVDGSTPIITYCTSGRQSAQIWFTLRHVAGLTNVSSYDGSWIDWTSKRLPTASGQ
ncbi:MAG: sulfurtransferase [Opitutales bacterium]